MTTNPATNEKVMKLVQTELTSNRRWLHRIALVGASTMLAIILALWTTEPKPMLPRLHVSFGMMTAIAVGWILVLTNILVRKNCPTVWDRIATAWMSFVGCATFTVASLVMTWLRGDLMAMLTLAVVSGGLLMISIFNLRNAYRWQDALRQRLSELGD